MNLRALPILNAIGCLALTGLVVAQWRKERSLDGALAGMTSQLAAAREQSAAESHRRAALERDVAVLKESIESTQQSAEASARSLADAAQATTRLAAELAAARQQLAVWQAAIVARDARIHSLTVDLTAARQRLDEAVAKLKTAAAR